MRCRSDSFFMFLHFFKVPMRRRVFGRSAGAALVGFGAVAVMAARRNVLDDFRPAMMPCHRIRIWWGRRLRNNRNVVARAIGINYWIAIGVMPARGPAELVGRVPRVARLDFMLEPAESVFESADRRRDRTRRYWLRKNGVVGARAIGSDHRVAVAHWQRGSPGEVLSQVIRLR